MTTAIRIAVLCVALVAALLPQHATAAPAALELRTLSNRADLVSGGDVLVEVVLPRGVRPADVTVRLGRRDVTDAFTVRPDGRFYGLVTGLRVGENGLAATARNGRRARLAVTNHPIGGPIFAGRQVQPWLCATEEHGLGPAQDDQCNAPTLYRYKYKSSVTGTFRDYDPDNPPADVATTTTDQGNKVPYIVRIERGTMDRGIYDIGILYNPDQPFTPWQRQPGWNGKLHVPFGGDCTPRHEQTAPPSDYFPTDAEVWVLHSVMIDRALKRGFAVATSGLNVLGQNCNDVVSAEALMMLKEHVVETYGEIRYTTAEGCSGGAMQQHWMAANYPGLVDGIQPACSFPDIWHTVQQAEDCHVMDRVFDQASPHLWAVPAQQAAAAGYASVGTCRSLFDGPVQQRQYADIWMNPQTSCGLEGENAERVYHPETNPDGVRCTLQDYQVALFGRRRSDGFANRPYDNVGVQYGLRAVESGEITAEQFVDLNANVGGLDIDWQWQPQRSTADPGAVRRAYRGGRVVHGGQLETVPIIDLRGTSNFEIHTDVHSYSLRDRLLRANGHHDNQIIWTSAAAVPDQTSVEAAFVLLDRWLAAIEADRSNTPLAEKVRRHRPAQAVEACWLPGGRKVTDMSLCRAAFPYYGTPRIAAGAPLADDVLKCRLKPLVRDDYDVTLTDAQWERLREAFPGGVCDYSRPGVAQRPPAGPWQTYAGGPDGRPLGRAPASS